MKPKVIHILNRLNIGGIVPQVVNTVKHLQDDFEVLLLSGTIEASEAGADYLLEGTGLKPVYIPDMQRGIEFKKDYKAYQQIKKIIQDFKPDIVHTHAAKPGALGRLAAIHTKVPVALHTFHGHVFHSYFGKAKTRFFLETERWLAKKTSAVVTISQLQKRELIEDFNLCAPNKMSVINYGYELDRFYKNIPAKRKEFRQQWKLEEEDIVIAIIGRVVPIKNHALFLKAFHQLLQKEDQNSIDSNQNPEHPKHPKHPKIKALIIGDGEEKENMQNLCDRLNLVYSNQPDENATVIFTSWIKDIENAYAGIDVLALSSLNEGTPISLIEAQAAGLPIVTTNVGGVKDTILENEHVLVVPSNDVDYYSKCLSIHIQNIKNKSAVEAIENRQFVAQKFGLNQMVANVKQLYFQLLEKANQG